MSAIPLTVFAWGALAMASAVAGLHFLRFWTSTRDRLFLFFCLGFWALSASWTGLALLPVPGESAHLHYLVRLAAFVLIIAGVVDKNRRASRSRRRGWEEGGVLGQDGAAQPGKRDVERHAGG